MTCKMRMYLHDAASGDIEGILDDGTQQCATCFMKYDLFVQNQAHPHETDFRRFIDNAFSSPARALFMIWAIIMLVLLVVAYSVLAGLVIYDAIQRSDRESLQS